jgi:hypothetical protein
MTKKNHKDLLVDTLEKAGVPRSNARRAKIIDWASDNRKGNDRVHASTNATIFNLLQKDELGTCVYMSLVVLGH